MANILLATANPLATATLAAGTTASAGPVGNLLRREPADAMILTNSGSAYVTIDLGADPDAIRVFAVLYCNAGTWRVRADDVEGDVTADPTYDSGTVNFGGSETGLRHRDGMRHDWIYWAAGVTYRYWRIDFADPDDDDGRTIVGNLIMDYGFQPAVNIAYGGSLGLVDPSRKPRSVDGQLEPLVRRPYMATEFAINFGTEAEMYGEAFDLDEIAATVNQVLYLRDPAATTYRQKQAVLGTFRALAPIVDASFDIYSKRYQIEELAA